MNTEGRYSSYILTKKRITACMRILNTPSKVLLQIFNLRILAFPHIVLIIIVYFYHICIDLSEVNCASLSSKVYHSNYSCHSTQFPSKQYYNILITCHALRLFSKSQQVVLTCPQTFSEALKSLKQ